ncbi:hypothetical protein [Dyadobacter jiangsuensis]|uniref:hypothetical protein n=1 Tax=Dyadobacter jiangsuensis TaxID=1591085 RepID=UPI004043936A
MDFVVICRGIVSCQIHCEPIFLPLRVVLNFELERELLGFGAKITVLGPRILKKQMQKELTRAAEQYSVPVFTIKETCRVI